MDNLTSTENSAINDEQATQKEVKKRLSYVSRDHKSMVDFVAGIYKNLGHTDYHSNKAIATIHGLSPDSIKQHLTSAQQYKLLELKHGTGYKITDLFKKIFLPLNESEKRTAIIESLKSPDTYTQLFKEYEFHILPPLNGIKNHFVRNFHFKEDIAEKTAQIFIDNLTEYSLLDARGVLISGLSIQSGSINDNNKDKEDTEANKHKNSSATSPHQEQPNSEFVKNLIRLPIHLPGEANRVAYFEYPRNLNKRDFKVIAKALTFVASSLISDNENEDYELIIKVEESTG